MSEAKNANFEPRCVVKADGSLANARHERLAILLSEGIEQFEAWRAAGGTTGQGSRKYGKRIFSNATFKARVAQLSEEKARLDEDPIWGEPIRMANQLWRMALLEGDVKTMGEAAKLRTQLADKIAPQAAAPAAEPAGEGQSPAGRKASESSQTSASSIADIKDRLMTRNRTTLEDTEAQGEA